MQRSPLGALPWALACGCWALACGCQPPSPEVAGADPARSVCGWERVEMGQATRLRVGARGEERASATSRLLLLEVEPAATFGAVKAALAPAAASLVRVKLVVEGRWLVPFTSSGRVPVEPPPRSKTVERVVGHRILRRPKGAPADRFADLRVATNRVRLFVENENPAGKELPIADLAARLRRVDPPATVFALTATGDTAWREVERALLAAACYDRRPGEEPHEVILD